MSAKAVELSLSLSVSIYLSVSVCVCVSVSEVPSSPSDLWQSSELMPVVNNPAQVLQTEGPRGFFDGAKLFHAASTVSPDTFNFS